MQADAHGGGFSSIADRTPINRGRIPMYRRRSQHNKHNEGERSKFFIKVYVPCDARDPLRARAKHIGDGERFR